MAGLMYGYKPGLPDGIEVAWGARAIMMAGGALDFLPDRQDAIGPDDERRAFLDYLVSEVGDKPWERVKALHAEGAIRHDRADEHTLYEDDTVIVKANTNASYGYLYVVAYRKADVAAAT